MKLLLIPALVSAALLVGCTEKSPSKAEPAAAAQPVEAEPQKTEIATPDITLSVAPEDVKKGEEIYTAKGCGACHSVGGGRLVGPDLKGVTARRDQEWIEKMILRPDVMVKKDPIAKKLLGEYYTPMPNQAVDPEKELPLILSYLKANE